eukprot:3701405-Rhodomonas_salina.1
MSGTDLPGLLSYCQPLGSGTDRTTSLSSGTDRCYAIRYAATRPTTVGEGPRYSPLWPYALCGTEQVHARTTPYEMPRIDA